MQHRTLSPFLVNLSVGHPSSDSLQAPFAALASASGHGEAPLFIVSIPDLSTVSDNDEDEDGEQSDVLGWCSLDCFAIRK
jgi:hypothetical protein